MPRGVTDQFIKILGHERKHAIRTALAMLPLAAVAYFMAELTDQPLLGPIVLLTIAALAVGLVAGGAYGHWRTKRYNDSLRASWNQWMRMSLSSRTVDEVARHVEEKGDPLPIAGVGWAALFTSNVLLFAALWIGTSWAVPFGAGVTVANGLVLGAVAGRALWSFRWVGQFNKALDELVHDGQLGLWGEL